MHNSVADREPHMTGRLTERQLSAHVHGEISTPNGRSIAGRWEVFLVYTGLVVCEYAKRLLLVDIRGPDAAQVKSTAVGRITTG